MDVSQINGSATGGSGVQGMGGSHHHHHHKNISDQISQMGSAIDNAVAAGTMTSDQATTLKSENSRTFRKHWVLHQAPARPRAQAQPGRSQSNPLSQLSDADRKKVFSELQDVRKQLHAANPQANSSSGGGNAASSLFSAIDSNGDGSISPSEFTQFLAQLGANALGHNPMLQPIHRTRVPFDPHLKIR